MKQPRYYPREPVLLTERMRQQVARAVRDLERAQAAAYRRMAQGTRAGLALAACANRQRVEVARVRQRYPDVGEAQARRIVRGMGMAAYERLRREQPDKMTR